MQKTKHQEIKKEEVIATEQACLTELNEVLKKHNCILKVAFQQDTILGQPILKYSPTIVYSPPTQEG